MGFDEENLEPKPRKLNKKSFGLKDDLAESKCQSKSFCVIYGSEKRQLSANGKHELFKNVSHKFGLDNIDSNFRFEFWSSVYQEWILLDEHLPEDNSKIQITEIVKNEKKNEELSNEFVSSLNRSFKKYLDSDDGSVLPEFETAIIFVLKRKAVADYLLQQHEQKSNTEVLKVNARVDQLEELVTKLSDELAALKSNVRQTKNQVEKLCLENDDEKEKDSTKKKDVVDKKSNKKEKKLKHTCFIC